MRQYIICIIGLVLCGVVLGLGQRVCVKKARSFAANQGYTPVQIENATRQQIFNVTGLTDPNEIKECRYYWSGIKEMLLRDAVNRRMAVRLVLLRQQLVTAYPDAVGLDTEYARELGRQLLPLLYGETDPNMLYGEMEDPNAL